MAPGTSLLERSLSCDTSSQTPDTRQLLQRTDSVPELSA